MSCCGRNLSSSSITSRVRVLSSPSLRAATSSSSSSFWVRKPLPAISTAPSPAPRFAARGRGLAVFVVFVFVFVVVFFFCAPAPPSVSLFLRRLHTQSLFPFAAHIPHLLIPLCAALPVAAAAIARAELPTCAACAMEDHAAFSSMPAA